MRRTDDRLAGRCTARETYHLLVARAKPTGPGTASTRNRHRDRRSQRAGHTGSGHITTDRRRLSVAAVRDFDVTLPVDARAGHPARYERERDEAEQTGLLQRLKHERDACGVGVIVAIDGKPRRDVVDARRSRR